MKLKILAVLATWAVRANGLIVAQENDTFIAIHNDRLSFTISKSNGFLGHLTLDGQDLQGPQSNSSGRGYYECHCVPMGFQVPGSDIFLVGGNATFQLLQGLDSTGLRYAGVFMQQVLSVGHTFQQWYFLRDSLSATGLHNFARLLYMNESLGGPFTDGGFPVREIREVWQFNTTLWQVASSNPDLNVTIPSQEAITPAIQVQDATWSLQGSPDEPFVQQTSDYWTKYSLADAYRRRKAHGLYGVTDAGMAYGAWIVSVTQDTLFGGPTHYDLLLDGMIGVPEGSPNLVRIPHIYYYFASSHQGAATSNLTNQGYDKTWGPQYLYFNKGHGSSLQKLRYDAEEEASFSKYAAFYDSIAHHVPGFSSSTNRGSISLSIALPPAAEDAVAVLSAEGFEFQSNILDLKAHQYWGDIVDGRVELTNVVEGDYRLTVYAKGVFGTFVQENIKVDAKSIARISGLKWIEESAGKELWRIGIPDRSAGEYKHGFERDPDKSYHIMEYRNYWGAYNFSTDFPNGVSIQVGKSDLAKDWNYAQFSEVGGDLLTPGNSTGARQKLNFTIHFEMAATPPATNNATFTIQLAGASGATGNEDFSSAQFASFPLNAFVNNRTEALQWVIPSNVSSSCVTRSGISCFFVAKKLIFPASWLVEGPNQLVLGLHPGSGTRVMYDALRLEVD
ncbi:galactose mutarotase-like protein [Mycena floridula]|nr:galactose mutarotase-like protein [Mycena floridula]